MWTIPFITIWVLTTGIFCTVQFKFINIRLFKYGIHTLINLNHNINNCGVITHIQAFSTALSGTIGLGTISGVAIAVTIGGPSTIFWMIITGIFCMSIKFAEVVLAFIYRSENPIGGSFYYIEYGLAKLGFIITGKLLAYIYAIILTIAMLLGGIPFQANQISMLSNNLFQYDISIIISIVVFIVSLGGIRSISFIATILTPIMVILYIVICIYIIYLHGHNLLYSFCLIFQDLFNTSAIGGGIFSGLITGIRRAVFANEAGTGTAAIAHSIVQERDPIKVGCVAMLAPFVDTVLISFLTGIIILITDTHNSINTIGDITLISKILVTDIPILKTSILPVMMFSFAFSTIIAYCYYYEVALYYLFGDKKISILFQIFIVISVYISCVSENIEYISYMGESLFMCLIIPNSIAIFLLRKEILHVIDSYYNSKRCVKNVL
ncbi:alanine/glycine:cation symporter family protein [Wolbachia endosymbiont of Howardula sp.]|uniref:alanine/glycine:cation symporter family protein n=1 Tax=Wolbachia endosymbiont of Howardula sp. TaxID=2916816 RepID=UPI00217DBC1B|nr:amino acid carrier protein [Wolbachia endosymbiont of Howardula sp.]UWI83326.1 amino acid carrier protein [Wolbachia endosymbiont of Howardula sp.]